MNNKKTLVILSPGFPVDENDSTCLPFQQLFVKTLNRLYPSLKLVIISYQYPQRKEPYYWFRNKVICINAKKGKLKKLYYFRRLRNVLSDLKDEYQLAGMLSFWYGEYTLVASRFCAKYHINHYCWLMGQDARSGNPFAKLLHPKSEELIALSDFISNEFYKNYKVKPKYTIPPGIDPSLYITPAVKKDIDIIGVGSLIPLKQYHLFIEIIKELSIKHPAVKAVLYGKGPEENKLKELAQNLSVENNIVFAGERSYTEVLHAMQRARVLLHTSAYEGFGMVCIEALFANAHVISFCKPMDKDIQNWHIAKNQQEMALKAQELLQADIPYKPADVYNIDTTVESIMALYIDPIS